MGWEDGDESDSDWDSSEVEDAASLSPARRAGPRGASTPARTPARASPSPARSRVERWDATGGGDGDDVSVVGRAMRPASASASASASPYPLEERYHGNTRMYAGPTEASQLREGARKAPAPRSPARPTRTQPRSGGVWHRGAAHASEPMAGRTKALAMEAGNMRARALRAEKALNGALRREEELKTRAGELEAELKRLRYTVKKLGAERDAAIDRAGAQASTSAAHVGVLKEKVDIARREARARAKRGFPLLKELFGALHNLQGMVKEEDKVGNRLLHKTMQLAAEFGQLLGPGTYSDKGEDKVDESDLQGAIRGWLKSANVSRDAPLSLDVDRQLLSGMAVVSTEEVGRMRRELNDKDEVIATLRKQMRDASGRAEEGEQLLPQYRVAVLKTKAELDTALAEREKSEKARKAAVEEVEDKERRLQEALHEVSSLRRRLSEQQEDAESLAARNERARQLSAGELEDLRRRVREAEQGERLARENARGATQRFEQLSAERSAQERLIADLQHTVEAQKADVKEALGLLMAAKRGGTFSAGRPPPHPDTHSVPLHSVPPSSAVPTRHSPPGQWGTPLPIPSSSRGGATPGGSYYGGGGEGGHHATPSSYPPSTAAGMPDGGFLASVTESAHLASTEQDVDVELSEELQAEIAMLDGNIHGLQESLAHATERLRYVQ